MTRVDFPLVLITQKGLFGFRYHETILDHIPSHVIGPLTGLGTSRECQRDGTAAYASQLVQPAPADWQGNENNQTTELISLPFPGQTPGKRMSVCLN